MQIKAVLFDLDGTLLPMDQDEFVKAYFGRLSRYLESYGYEPKSLIKAIWTGTRAMVCNNGEKSNEQVFWDVFCSIYGENARKDEPHFAAFYATQFERVRSSCGFTPEAAQTVRWIKDRGMRVILATNPIFPTVATESRIRWAGLEPEEFEGYTTYENARFCKPNLSYYEDILAKYDLRPEECLMVGNDVGEDMVTEQLGMQVFLLTDCLINKKEADINQYPHGGFSELVAFVREKEASE